MENLRKLLAILLASLLIMGTAMAEMDAPEGIEAVEEVGEIDLPAEVAAPAAPEGEAPVEAPPAAEPVAEPASEAPASEAAVAAPAEESAVSAPAAFPEALTLGVKEQYTLDGLALTGGQPVAYVSSNPKLVAVDGSGVVTARKKGSATVTVYLGETPIAACAVTVLKAPSKLTFPEKKGVVISAGQVRPFPATLSKGSAGSVYYASDNPAIMTVDAAGNLYGVSGGMATVTATAYNGKRASCAVRVLGGPAPSMVALDQTALLLPVKGTAQLNAFFDAGCDAILSWASSNKKIVAVSDSGLVTAKKAGQATVTVTTHNGLTAACEVQIYIAPKKVSLNTKKATLHVNDGLQLIATVTKNSITELAWTSDNPNVASVDANGFVAANNVGKANITVTTSNGKRAACKITVQDLNPVGRGTLIYQEDTDTLKIKVVDDHGVMLTYIWVANANQQLFKQYGNALPKEIMATAVQERGLGQKLIIAFNSSPPVSPRYDKGWFDLADYYKYREPLPLMITNGEVLVNDPNQPNNGKYIYWIDSANQLCATDKMLDQYSAEERAALYQQIIASGARNTMIWRPILVRNHVAVPMSKAFLDTVAGPKRKQALCQVDANNFILVTSTDKGLMDYPQFQKYLLGLGVATAVEFDAGASTCTLYKSKYADSFTKVMGGGRKMSMMTYFTEG